MRRSRRERTADSPIEVDVEVVEDDPNTSLTAWDRVKLARDPDRPHTLSYIDQLMTGFVELHGDRRFGDDKAIVGGLARFDGDTVVVIGHQKGSDTRENLRYNFGMARPEGYRKAERLMKHAEKFGIPVITFIDTPGAEPGVGSEERGQGTAIAESLLTMASLKTPVISMVIGEGGSGGALAIGMSDRILMLENAVYAVASPEACAAILRKDTDTAPDAAETMRITAADLFAFGIVDEIVPEPVPAHEAPQATISAAGEALTRQFEDLMRLVDQPSGIDRLMELRYEKYRRMGIWEDAGVTASVGRE
ncbi:MAG: acetyl-CoA carboxylase carboxyltransferase subunit alpha [Thermomicrobiales bacterium]|nr:MAG: acetyl-CoA carboxylase carboxyltransferase subunit alpha [Thermomicrobiales bacterium]